MENFTLYCNSVSWGRFSIINFAMSICFSFINFFTSKKNITMQIQNFCILNLHSYILTLNSKFLYFKFTQLYFNTLLTLFYFATSTERKPLAVPCNAAVSECKRTRTRTVSPTATTHEECTSRVWEVSVVSFPCGCIFSCF